jgi:hypothetical protein
MNTELLKGSVLGIIIPIILFILVVVFYLGYSLTFFINNLITNYNLPIIISLTLFGNLALLLIKFQMNKDEQSRGILFSTILYGIIIVILKFI